MQKPSSKADLQKKKPLLALAKIRQLFDRYRESTPVVEESKLINLRRLNLLTMIAIPVHIAIILQFITTPFSQDIHREFWRVGIIICHSVLLALMILFFILTYRIRRKPVSGSLAHFLHHAAITMILSAGIAIVTIDQLATTNVTPFLLACILVGTVFLTRPIFSLLYNLVAYITYFLLIALTQHDPSVILSNRVNGLTAVATGFAISSMMWRYNFINFRQKQRIIEQQELLKEKNQELEKMAFFDSLTNLPNRRYFDQIIKKEIALVNRNSRESCLIMLDIDHFKDVNDTYGHPAGDAILNQVARLLQSCIRQSDLIARLGGEEFILLLPETELDGAIQAAEKLRQAIEHMSFIVGQQAICITASFGVSPIIPNKEKQINYYAECDRALYLAKQKGRNRVETTITA